MYAFQMILVDNPFQHNLYPCRYPTYHSYIPTRGILYYELDTFFPIRTTGYALTWFIQ